METDLWPKTRFPILPPTLSSTLTNTLRTARTAASRSHCASYALIHHQMPSQNLRRHRTARSNRQTDTPLSQPDSLPMPALAPLPPIGMSLPLLCLSVTHHALHPFWMYSPAKRFSKCRLSHSQRYQVAPSAFPPANSGSPLGVPSKPTAVSPPIQPRTSTPAALAPPWM